MMTMSVAVESVAIIGPLLQLQSLGCVERFPSVNLLTCGAKMNGVMLSAVTSSTVSILRERTGVSALFEPTVMPYNDEWLM